MSTTANDFLPISTEDMKKRGWDSLDFLYIVGDAYVDHPSFGHAIISRVLEKQGYRVGICALPDWRSLDDFTRMGRPKLGVLVSAGNIDSMVNHYTVSKKRRHDDMYAPGGKWGMRPDRATIVYCNRIKEAFGSDMPILIGGVEASLRRFAHYDYWDDKIRRSILFDSRADILMYGMGEKQIVEIADRLRDGESVKNITDVRGTCYISSEYDAVKNVRRVRKSTPHRADCNITSKTRISERRLSKNTPTGILCRIRRCRRLPRGSLTRCTLCRI